MFTSLLFLSVRLPPVVYSNSLAVGYKYPACSFKSIFGISNSRRNKTLSFGDSWKRALLFLLWWRTRTSEAPHSENECAPVSATWHGFPHLAVRFVPTSARNTQTFADTAMTSYVVGLFQKKTGFYPGHCIWVILQGKWSKLLGYRPTSPRCTSLLIKGNLEKIIMVQLWCFSLY